MQTIRRTLSLSLAILALVVSGAYAQSTPNVTGTWAFEVMTDQGGGQPTITFKQEGEKLTGHYQGTFGEADLTGTVKGKDIAFTFTVDLQGQQAPNSYKGTIESATTMKGTLDIAGMINGTFTAKKK